MKYKLSELSQNVTDGEHGSVKDNKNGECFLLSCKNIKNGKIEIGSRERRIDVSTKNRLNKRTNLEIGDILITTVGTIGEMAMIRDRNIYYSFQRSVGVIKPNQTKVIPEYLYYAIMNESAQINTLIKGAVQKCLFINDLKSLRVDIPDLETQQKAVRILSALDKKIELNSYINKVILESIDNIFLSSFTGQKQQVKASELADITIGKTPPRKEQECFTRDSNDVKWLSISDMGKIGTFAIDTSEKLTRESIKKYSIKIVPKDTVVLSFKLTLGRIAILDDDMTTNEAIAHFRLKNKEMHTYYLFSVLRNYDYSQLGSTSSIATAINSKIVKSMPIVLPADDLLVKYNSKVKPLFEKIRTNERQNRVLSQLRDSLLPKLMDSEVKI